MRAPSCPLWRWRVSRHITASAIWRSVLCIMFANWAIYPPWEAFPSISQDKNIHLFTQGNFTSFSSSYGRRDRSVMKISMIKFKKIKEIRVGTELCWWVGICVWRWRVRSAPKNAPWKGLSVTKHPKNSSCETLKGILPRMFFRKSEMHRNI